MSGPDIFISYCREERAAARHFAESFAREGFDVWWDAVLRSGQTFDEVIETQLRAAKAVVVLWSPRSVTSRWVRAEATLADRGNKLVPVIIEACNLPIIFELTHAADLSKWTGDTSDSNWQTLVSDLRRLTGDEADSAEAELPPKKPGRSEAPASKPLKAEPDPDELVRALERITKARAPDLTHPTQQEEEMTQFFRRSDAYHLQEGDRFHCLQRLEGDVPGARFVVTPAGLTIGRSAPADVIVAGSAVSRAHCLVELAGDRLRVTDLNSTNGTFIDNERIEGSSLFEVGSILRVGNVLFEHEVTPRSEMEQQDLLRFANDSRPAISRVAKS